MKILSLFDGMSCGQIAFERAGIKVDKYYASEIDKYAIKVTQSNYPDTIQLGSITEWKSWNIEKPDIIIGGSPCQGFSFAGKGLNFDDPRSKLFFTFIDILKHYKPKYFLLENVIMKKEHNDVISSILGEMYPECVEHPELFRTGRLEPIEINSALVSAQNRRRLYWTNIPGITQPEDKGILLKDIIEDAITDKDKSYCLDANYFKGCSKEYSDLKGRRQLVRQSEKCEERRISNRKSLNDKGNSLLASTWKGEAANGCTIINDNITWRKLTPIECERLQTAPDNYTKKGLDICYYDIIQLIKMVTNGDYKCKNAKLKDAKIKYQTKQQDYVINITCEWLDMGRPNLPEIMLINQKNVKLKDVIETSKQIMDYACSILKDLKDQEQPSLKIEKLKNVSIAIETQFQKDFAINIIKITTDTETRSIQIINEKNLISMDIKNLMENIMSSIEKYTKKDTISSYQKMILSIILTLTNKIMILEIFTDVTYQNTQLYTNSLIKLQGNLLELELSSLKMENIISISNSQRYKMLGNGWTVDVISHIFSFIPKTKEVKS